VEEEFLKIGQTLSEKSTPKAPAILDLTVHQGSKKLEVSFAGGERFEIAFELLRIYSPSAEVKGHGPGQEVLQTGKRGVGMLSLEPVGNYAVQPTFSDGHDSGIFTWDYLYHLGSEQDRLWRDYEKRLQDAGRERDAPMPVAAGHGCASH
jgi:DUF971 family protein